MFEGEAQELSFEYVRCWMPNRHSVEMSSRQLNLRVMSKLEHKFGSNQMVFKIMRLRGNKCR